MSRQFNKEGWSAVIDAVTNDRGEYRSFNIPRVSTVLLVSYEPGFQQRGSGCSVRNPIGATEETYALTYYPLRWIQNGSGQLMWTPERTAGL